MEKNVRRNLPSSNTPGSRRARPNADETPQEAQSQVSPPHFSPPPAGRQPERNRPTQLAASQKNAADVGDAAAQSVVISSLVEGTQEGLDQSGDSPVIPCSSQGPTDPFANLNHLRLSQDFTSLAAVKPVFTTIPVRRPNKSEFVRVRAGADWRFEAGCFFDEEAEEIYLVAPCLHSMLPGEVRPTTLLLTITRNSPVPFLWPIPLPGPDGRSCSWHETARDAAKLAERSWLRVISDRAASCYVPHIAAGNLADPIWPDGLGMSDILRLAFQDRFIDSFEHPILRRLRGEI